MSDDRAKKGLRFFAHGIDKVHNVETDFYIEAPYTPGPRSTSPTRSLVVRDDKAAPGLRYPVGEDRRPEFVTGIPDHWTDDEIMKVIMDTSDISRKSDPTN
jgi:hypothetical protein